MPLSLLTAIDYTNANIANSAVVTIVVTYIIAFVTVVASVVAAMCRCWFYQ